MTPYLQLLLNRKRPTSDLPYDDPNDPLPVSDGPTIPIRSRPSVTKQPMITPRPTSPLGVVDSPTLAQQPTIPITRAGQPVVTPAATIGIHPNTTPPGINDAGGGERDIIGEDREALIKAQRKPHNKALQILEGLGNYAASGIGLNLHRIIHPGGTETEKAQRQLSTDIALQKARTDQEQGQADVEDKQATIALRSAQARKIDADLSNPDTSEEDKRKLEIAKEILKSHPQPFDPNDPKDAVAMKKLEDAGIPIPSTYGKQPKEGAGFTLGPGQTRFGADGKPIANLPANEKPEVDYPTRAAGYYSLQKQAETEAEKLRQEAMSIGNVLDKNGYPDEDAKVRKEDLLRRANEADQKSRDFHAKAIEAETEPTRSQSNQPKLTIEGAIEHFTKKKGRAPSKQEIANMQAALNQ